MEHVLSPVAAGLASLLLMLVSVEVIVVDRVLLVPHWRQLLAHHALTLARLILVRVIAQAFLMINLDDCR